MKEIIWKLRMKGLTMKQIAEGSKIHYTNLSKYLHGAYRPNPETEYKLMKFALKQNVHESNTNSEFK